MLMRVRATSMARGGKMSSGFPTSSCSQVGAMIQSGDSAIYTILRHGEPESVADQFRGYGGTILSTLSAVISRPR